MGPGKIYELIWQNHKPNSGRLESWALFSSVLARRSSSIAGVRARWMSLQDAWPHCLVEFAWCNSRMIGRVGSDRRHTRPLHTWHCSDTKINMCAGWHLFEKIGNQFACGCWYGPMPDSGAFPVGSHLFSLLGFSDVLIRAKLPSFGHL